MRKSPGRRGTTRIVGGEVAALSAATRAMLEHSRFPEVAGAIVAECRASLGAAAAFLAVPRGRDCVFEVLYVASAGRDLGSAVGTPVPLRRLVARATKSGRSVFANKLSESDATGLEGIGLPSGRNALVAPIMIDGDLAGVVVLANKTGGFSTADSGLASVFAGLVAVAMSNRRDVSGLESSERALRREVRSGAAELRKSEDELKTLVENLPDIIARFDTGLRLISVSATIKLLTDRPVEDLEGMTIMESGMPPEVALPWDAALRRVLATGHPENLELELPGPEPKRHFDCRLVPEHGPQEQIESVLSVARDVTARWLALETEARSRYVAEALRETTMLLNRSLDRERVLVTLLDCLRRLIPFDRAQVMLLDASRVSVRAIFDGNDVVTLAPELRKELDPSAHPIVWEIVTNGTTVMVPDIRNDPDWSLPVDGSSEVSWIGVPLFARGRVTGLFSLSRSEPGPFSEEHVRVAEAMSSQASVAVENAILFEQVQAGSARMQALSHRLVDAQEDERRHVARELHDEAGQAMVSLRYGLRLLEREIDSGGSVADRLTDLVQRTDAVIDGLHRLAADLRPAILTHLGLEVFLRQYARRAGVESGLAVHFKARGLTGERLLPAVETTIYRVVQEAMANIVRHGKASRVDILAERHDNRVRVMVEDDGVGFEPDLVVRGDHFGLLGMRERAAALGGTLAVESKLGAGTTIVVEVPVDNPNSNR